MADINALVTGRSFLEGPRWHDGALYVSDMHGDAVLRVGEDGEVFTLVELEQPSGLVPRHANGRATQRRRHVNAQMPAGRVAAGCR